MVEGRREARERTKVTSQVDDRAGVYIYSRQGMQSRRASNTSRVQIYTKCNVQCSPIYIYIGGSIEQT